MDRNRYWVLSNVEHPQSLSARRAWIEICGGVSGKLLALVALRKESVDRNHELNLDWILDMLSLSARRAWIEISRLPATSQVSVCRSPQGERG